MNTQSRQRHPWTDSIRYIPLLFILFLGACATGHLPYYHAQAGDQELLLPCPLSVTSGRFGAAWTALCRHDTRHARALISDLALDSPGRNVHLLTLLADATENKPGAWSSLESALEGEKPGPARVTLFRAEVEAINGHFLQAWNRMQTLPDSWKKRRKIAHWSAAFREKAIKKIGDEGMNAFQAEDKKALDHLLETFPVSLREDRLHTELTTAFKALDTPDDVNPDQLTGLKEPWGSAISSYLKSLHRTLEVRIRQAHDELQQDPDNQAIQRRLFFLKKRWEVNNLPPFFSESIASTRLTRMQFSLIVAWLFPGTGINDGETPPLFVDLLDRPESRFVLPLLAHHLLPFTPGPLRTFEPGRMVTAGQVVTTLVNIASTSNVELCGDSLEKLQTCGGVPQSWSREDPVTGEEAIQLLQPIAWRLHAEN